MTIAAAPADGEGALRAVPPDYYEEASWRDSAACQDVDTELFFPIAKAGIAAAETRRAKAVCARCPVRRECLSFALSTHQEFGIWGGYDEDERRLLHRQWREALTAAVRDRS
jgi:WhiB family redox-sensing transcriptional regulator